jgi:hypothetical protein
MSMFRKAGGDRQLGPMTGVYSLNCVAAALLSFDIAARIG